MCNWNYKKIFLNFNSKELFVQKDTFSILTETIIETILLRMASISDSLVSFKQTSHTPTILCKSSSIPFGDFSSDISAPRLLKYFLSSCACKHVETVVILPNVVESKWFWGYINMTYLIFERYIHKNGRTLHFETI